MAGTIQSGADALVMDAKDHVATAIQDLSPGQTIQYALQGEMHALTLAEHVPFGHKAAIADIPAGTEVRKYGEIIGRATAFIRKGEHVHVHNLEGIRGRGDQAAAGKEGART